ncbi:DUF5667 domain-containing protein [Streptomyces sp. NPDC127098]|uniref:DUF5667 domain-containing protein n=1 Tax=Streptomyces sp. NPDC127098 TaxID=3347137 RepID=UPI003651BD32
MIGSVSANRRANAFAQLLDETGLEQPRLDSGPAAADQPADGPEQAALLSLVDRLAALPRPELRAGTKAEQRAMLIAALERGGEATAGPAERLPGPRRARPGRGSHRAVPVPRLSALRPRSRLTKGLAAGGLTMGVAAGAFGGVAAASTDALPGDTLYGLKRGMEDLRLDFTDGDADRGRVYLDHAATRLNEARRLLERQRAGALDDDDLGAIHRALTNMRDDAAEGHRLLSQAYENGGSIDPMASLSTFSATHRDAWSDLRLRLPAQLRGVGTEVNDVFEAMEDDIAPLRSVLPREPRDTASAGHDPSAAHQPSTTAESPTGDHRQEPAAPDDHRPAPSGTPKQETPEESHGLLDVPSLPGTDDLLPGSADDRTSESPTDPPSLGTPDVTIPPLVEDLLPSLGLDVNE